MSQAGKNRYPHPRQEDEVPGGRDLQGHTACEKQADSWPQRHGGTVMGKAQQPQNAGPALPAGRKPTLYKWEQVTWGALSVHLGTESVRGWVHTEGEALDTHCCALNCVK